jgi:hypothetical protein
MLKPKVQEFIETLFGSDENTKLILAALMTDTLSRTDPISSENNYLARLYRNYAVIENIDWLEEKMASVKGFTINDR